MGAGDCTLYTYGRLGGSSKLWWVNLNQYMGEHAVAPKKGLVTKLPVTFGSKIDKNTVINIGCVSEAVTLIMA